MAQSAAKTAGVFSTLAGKLRGASTMAGRPAAQAAQSVAHTATVAGRPAAQAAQSAAQSTLAARPVAVAHAPTRARHTSPAAYSPTLVLPTPPVAAAPAAATSPTFPPARRAMPDPSQVHNPVDKMSPGFLAHDRRLRGVQQKLEARRAAGKLTKEREGLLHRVSDKREDLSRQLAAKTKDPEITLEPHLRSGREVALRPSGLSAADEYELTARATMPRKGTPEQRAKRMPPALTSTQYERQALSRGKEDPAMKTIADTLTASRERGAMIPRAIMPKMGSLRLPLLKRAYLSNALRNFGQLAHTDPVRALAHSHAADQALRGALGGALVGGLGGAAISRPGDTENMALRGALAGGLGGAVYSGIKGHDAARTYLATPEGRKAVADRLRALQQAGAPLAQAFTL